MRFCLLPCFLLSALILAGCSEDTQIRTYTVAKRPQSAQSEAGPAQMLGVILPNNGNAWFLKLMDDPNKVASLESDFRSLAESIHFNDQGLPEWTLGSKWSDDVLKQITYAKFQHADGATGTLTQLSADTENADSWANYVKDNINRWRGQLSLPPQEWSEMQSQLEEIPGHSTQPAKAYFVSLEGQRQSSGSGMGSGAPFLDRMRAQSQAQAENPAEPADQPPELKYDIPEGWRELPASGFRLASFEVGSDADLASVSVSTAGGSLDSSIGMWLQQVGAAAEQSTVESVAQSGTDGETNGVSYKCYTIPSTDENSGMIRVAVIPLSKTENLYVKMTGPKKVVTAQTEAMDQFVSGLKW